jgi:hypothetical protein
MKKLTLTLTAAVMLLVIGCKSGGSGNDPKATLHAFLTALSKKDLKEARKHATKESESMLNLMEMGMNMADKSQKNETEDELKKMDPNNMVFGEPKIEGDKATVTITNKLENEPANFILKKEEGNWKVAFDKASMAEMAGEKMKEENAGEDINMDSLTNELKNLNTDSLKAAMQEGMKALDSLKKQ